MLLKKRIIVKESDMESSHSYRLLKTWAEIDMTAFRRNYKSIRKSIGPETHIMAVVKCNAYGHGAVEISQEAANQGAAALGVSSLFEGIELRGTLPDIPIVVLSSGMSGQAEEFITHRLTPVVCSWEMVNALTEIARIKGTRASIHIKIDTGMGRIGVWHERADEFVRDVFRIPELIVDGVCSHFATADEEDLAFAQKQLSWFSAFLDKIQDLPIPYKHISNTGAIFNLPGSHLNMIRPGLSLYGVPPSPHIQEMQKLNPILSLKTKIAFIKNIPPGRTLSYGRTFQTDREMTVATLPVGYGDGYPRFLSNRGHVLIKGKRARILGTVTMDQIMVDITEIKDVRVGDIVVLIGRQGKEEITAAEIAALGGTIPYEIFTSINKRVQRVYLEKG